MNNVEVITEKYDYANMEREMIRIFNSAVNKALLKCSKKGNTDKPWDDFPLEHLENRLIEEVNEYFDNPKMHELYDIIISACFCCLAREKKFIEESANINF